MKNKVEVVYFSDILCIWAYAAQFRVDELIKEFDQKINLDYRFISVFGDAEHFIGKAWEDRGGFEAYTSHVIETAKSFPGLTVNPQIWRTCKPKTSAMAHLYFHALNLLEQSNKLANATKSNGGHPILESFIKQVRNAFFVDALDISNLDVLNDIAQQNDLPVTQIVGLIHDGSAMASLMRDYQLKDHWKLDGSPTYVLNNGRQKLYGNVGYRAIKANIEELCTEPASGASWC